MEVIEVKPRQTATAEAVSLVWHPHPVTPIAGREMRACAWSAGRTVRETLLHAGVDPHQPIVVTLDDRLLTVEEWDHVCPVPGQLLNVQATVMGGGGGGSNPLAVVASLALVIVAPYAAAALNGALGLGFAAGSIGMSMLTAGVVVAGSMVIGAIFPPTMPSTGYGNTPAASPTYSLTGGSNRSRPYEPMPVVFGTHRLFPDLGSRPYTEFQGEDQYLYQIFHLGLSSLQLSDWSIGSTPITNYADYTWSYPDANGKIQAFPGNVDTASGSVLTKAGGWVTRTTSTSTYKIGLDVQATLYYANDSGNLDQRSVDIEVQIAVAGSGNWTAPASITAQGTGATIAGNVITMAGASQTPRRATIFITPASAGVYDVRLRRTTDDSTATREQTGTSWDSIKSYQADTANYINQTRMGLSIRASEQLNGVLQQVSVTASAQANYWNGSTWVMGYTSNPAHWFADFARGRRDSSGRLLYGLGLPDSQIDLAVINAWAAFCTTEGLTCNMVLDAQRTAADVLSILARCGFASPSWGSGKLGVVWDARNASPVAAFGMSNIVRGTFTVSYVTEQLAEEIVVRYVNPAKDWAQDEVRVTAPGVSSPQLVSTIELMGCTSQAMAGKYANYLAAQQFYRRRRITWETDFEGFVCQRGDVVMLSHDLTQWGYSGRVVAVNGNTLTLDRTVPRSGSQDYVMLRRPDGTMTTYTVTTSAAGDADTLTLTSTPGMQGDALPVDHIWMFSPLPTPGKKVKITTVEPLSESRLRVTATDEDAGFYSAWDGSFTAPAASTLLTDTTPVIAGLAVSPSVTRTLTGEATTHVVARWNLLSGTQERAVVRYRMGGDWQQLQTGDRSATFDIRGTGTVEVAVTAINGAVTGNTLTNTAAAVIPSSPPAAPTTTVGGLMFGVRVTWTFGDTRSDIAGTEVWYSVTNNRATAARLTFEPYPATDYIHPGLTPGQGGYYWARVVDVWGNASPWAPTGANSGMYAAALAEPDQLLTQLKKSVGLDQLVGELAQPIVISPGALNAQAQAMLQAALADYDLTSRMQWQETVTNATVTVDPVTGQIQLLATAQITTDVESRLTSVEVLVNADHATLVSTVNSLSSTQQGLSTAQSQITQLQNSVSVGASQTYVDNAIATSTGGLSLTAANTASANAQAELQSALDAFAHGNSLIDLTANTANAQQNLAALATALDAEATSRSFLVATVAANGAAIVSEQVARANAVSAEAAARTALEARVATTEGASTANAAAITAEQQARASGDSANAQSINSLTARLDTGDFAAVKQQSSATASAVSGLSAQYVLQVQTMQGNNLRVAGMQLASGQSGSSVVWLADKLLFAMPDGSGTPKQVLVVGNINGTATLGLDGDMVVDGSLTARSLAAKTITAASGVIGDLAVDYLQIANEAVSTISSYYSINTNTTSQTFPVTFNMAHDGSYVVIASVEVFGYDSGYTSSSVAISGGNTIYGSGSLALGNRALMTKGNANAGSVTVNITCNGVSGVNGFEVIATIMRTYK